MKRMILLSVLVFLFFTSFVTVYSYWDSSQDVFLDGNTPTFIVDQKLSTNSNQTIVPLGSILKVGDVTSVQYTYEVILADGYSLEAHLSQLTLSNDMLDSDTLSSLFNFSFEIEDLGYSEASNGLLQAPSEGINYLVTLTVTMNMPESELVYNSIAGAQISFNVVLDALKY